MFALAHVYFSELSGQPVTDVRSLGSLLPDAAITGALSWTELHDENEFRTWADSDRLATFAAEQNLEHEVASIVEGIEHHIALDNRSHHRWKDGTGYAYAKQTDDLVATVGRACNVGAELDRILAHNFIECAVDLHLVKSHPELVLRVRSLLDDCDVAAIAGAIAVCRQSDAAQVAEHIAEYIDLCRSYDPTSVDGMLDYWARLLTVLRRTTFAADSQAEFDRTAGRAAVEIAVDLTKNDFLEVATPSRSA